MVSVPGSLASSLLVPWRFWCTIAVCVQLLLTLGSTYAGRTLQQQAPQQRRLQAYSDGTCSDPRHAPPVQSFQVSDGSWVDCVPIEGQISAHHPALKDHIIQMSPSSPRRSSNAQARRSELHPQLFAQEHGACPEGSIPVQRADPNRPLLQKTQSLLSVPAAGDATHEYATTKVPNQPQYYSGAHSIFSVNGPALEDQNTDFSLSQVWIVDGFTNDSTLSTIEVGWQKYPDLHKNDTNPLAPYLFVFWTNDNYNDSIGVKGSHGCYNLGCPGFLQTSNKWVIGGAMPFYTTLAENAKVEYEVEIEVLYNPSDSKWWLFLDNESVGYWPSAIYTGTLQGSARRVSWGGEVVFIKDAANPTVHSKTTMGSGAFPKAGYPVAAYQRNITYADVDGTFYRPDPAVLRQQTTGLNLVTDPLCYDIAIQQGNFTNWGTYFFFGGSGGNNPGCVGKP